MSLTINPGVTLKPGVSMKVPVYVPPPQSFSFNGVDNQYVQVTNASYDDWALGDNYTFEWWEKVSDASLNTFYSVMCQRAGDDCVDIFHNYGYIQLFDGNLEFTQPAFGSWNHIAIQKDGTTTTMYVNGHAQSATRNTKSTLSRNDLNLVIGSRGDGLGNFYGQRYKGLLTNIRVSAVARYSNTFTPPLTLEVDEDTVLALDGSLIDKSPKAHVITNYGATISTDFPT